MNRNGQTLILFVILIPVLLILAALVIDIGIISNEKMHVSKVTSTILKETFEKEETVEEIKKLYEKNNIPTENLKIEKKEDQMTIENNYEINSIFGNIIGIKKYSIHCKKKIVKQNNQLKLIEE